MAHQLRTADVTLPVIEIINANAAWVRTYWPDSSRLRRSLSSEGMHVPVLVNRDWEVIDGARRVLIAKELGWERVPATVASDWPTVVAHFQYVRELDRADFPSAPMRWLELFDLITRFLLPIHKPYSLELGVKRRTQGLGVDLGIVSSGRIHQGLNELLGLPGPATSIGIVQVGRALARAQREKGIQFEKTLRAAVERIEETTGQLYAADSMVRSAIRMSQIPTLVSDEKIAAEQVTKIDRILQVLEAGTTEAGTLGNLNVAIELATAQKQIARLRPVIRAANGLLRTLQTHIEIASSKEKEQ